MSTNESLEKVIKLVIELATSVGVYAEEVYNSNSNKSIYSKEKYLEVLSILDNSISLLESKAKGYVEIPKREYTVLATKLVEVETTIELTDARYQLLLANPDKEDILYNITMCTQECDWTEKDSGELYNFELLGVNN